MTGAAHRPRLLIADDDPVIRTMLAHSLGDEFDVVGVASDGEQAFELARTSQPDAALIDVEMPKGGGLSAVHGIVESSRDTAIVVLSVDESDATVRESDGGGSDFLPSQGRSTAGACGIPDRIDQRSCRGAASAVLTMMWHTGGPSGST